MRIYTKAAALIFAVLNCFVDGAFGEKTKQGSHLRSVPSESINYRQPHNRRLGGLDFTENDFLKFTFHFNVAGSVNYNAATDHFTVSATPDAVVKPPSGYSIIISTIDIGIQVDDSGDLIKASSTDKDCVLSGILVSSGSSISGTGPDGLLTGKIVDFDYVDDGNTDIYKFVFRTTGGELPMNGETEDYYMVPNFGVIVYSGNSDFEGDFTKDFGGFAEGFTGPLPADSGVSASVSASADAIDGVYDVVVDGELVGVPVGQEPPKSVSTPDEPPPKQEPPKSANTPDEPPPIQETIYKGTATKDYSTKSGKGEGKGKKSPAPTALTGKKTQTPGKGKKTSAPTSLIGKKTSPPTSLKGKKTKTPEKTPDPTKGKKTKAPGKGKKETKAPGYGKKHSTKDADKLVKQRR